MTLYWPTVSQTISAGGEYLAKRPGHVPPVHQGCDVSIGVGTTIYASGDGVVIALTNSGNTSGGGRVAQVRYGNVVVFTEHMSAYADELEVGTVVSVSSVLGLSGGAFHSDGAGDSTGPHCHVEVHTGGILTDPFEALADRSTIAGGGNTPTPDQEQDDQMATIHTDDTGSQWLVGNFTRVYLDPYHSALWGRYSADAHLNSSEYDICVTMLQSVNFPAPASTPDAAHA